MPSHPLTNFEVQKYYQNEPKFNGVHSRNNSSKIKDGVYIINLDEYEPTGTHWIALYVNAKNVTYFDSFKLNILQKKLENSLKIEIYFCIGFIDFMLKGKGLLEYRNLFSPKKYKK